jgi:uncharacterized membrane protein (DUF485 family)
MSQSGSRGDSLLGSLPIQRGALAGVGAFVVGYVLTYLIKSGDIKDKTPDDGVVMVEVSGEETELPFSEIGVDPPEVTEVVSWLFYEMHRVEMAGTLTRTVTRDGENNSTEYDLLLGVDVETYMTLVPPLLLAAAGYWVVSSIAVSDEGEAAKAGATVAVGYFVTAIIGALVFAYNDLGTEGANGFNQQSQRTIEVAFSVDLQSAAIMAGVVYPLAFGALGGYIAHKRASSMTPTSGRRTPPRDPPQQPPRTGDRTGSSGRGGDDTRNPRGDNRSVGRQGNQRAGQQQPNRDRQSNQARGGRSGRSDSDS